MFTEPLRLSHRIEANMFTKRWDIDSLIGTRIEKIDTEILLKFQNHYRDKTMMADSTYKRRFCVMHSSLRHIMRLCRWAGYFPVEGLSNKYPGRVRFNFHSAYTAYYVVSFTALMLQAGILFYGFLFNRNRNNLDHTSNLAFYLSNITTAALLYKLAKHWPKLLKAATEIEHDITDVNTSKSVYVKTSVLTYIIMALALLEFILCRMFRLNKVMKCLGYTRFEAKVFEDYYKNLFAHIFDFIPHSSNNIIIILGIFAEIVSIQGTFLWNFTDVMGMCFSIYLTSYFRDLENIINSDKPKDWAKLRSDYSRVVVFLNIINDQLAPFILLSSLNNLFFICLQLFNNLRFLFSRKTLLDSLCDGIDNHSDDVEITTEYSLYYLYSFVFLMVRALMFAHLAANVHTTANKAVLTLYEVPDSEYDREVQCFQMQLRYTTIGLSGLFFYVKRKIILRVIGTIITYELVLLQFSYQGNSDVGYKEKQSNTLYDI